MSGVCYQLERTRGGDAALWRYDGSIETECTRWEVAFEVVEGDVRALRSEAPEPYMRFMESLLRIAARSATKRGQPPPRRLRRWRSA